MCRVRGEDGEQSGDHHKEGSSGGVHDFEFIGGSDKFATIPEAGSGFDCQEIDYSGEDEGSPSDDQVILFKLIHLIQSYVRTV